MLSGLALFYLKKKKQKKLQLYHSSSKENASAVCRILGQLLRLKGLIDSDSLSRSTWNKQEET